MRLTTMQWLVAAVAAGAIHHSSAIAQTPEQQQMWDAQRAQAQADERAKDGAARQAARGPQSGPHGLGTHAGSHVLGRLGIQGGGR